MLYKQAQQFQTVYENIKENRFPVKLAYKLMQLNALAIDCIKFSESQYTSIISDCAERDENGQYIQADEGSLRIIPEKVEEATHRLAELENFEFDLPKNRMLTFDELQDISNICQLSLEEMNGFMGFILDDENPTD